MSYKLTVLPDDPHTQGFAAIERICYSTATGKDLSLELMRPWDSCGEKTDRYPAIVFVQGSAWTSPNLYAQIPQLCDLARRGYVVATIEHRSSLEGAPWPAYRRIPRLLYAF